MFKTKCRFKKKKRLNTGKHIFQLFVSSPDCVNGRAFGCRYQVYVVKGGEGGRKGTHIITNNLS